MTTSGNTLREALRWAEDRERDTRRHMRTVNVAAFAWMFFILIDALTAGDKRDAVLILLAAVTGLVIGGAWVRVDASLKTVSEAVKSIRTYVREAEEHERRFPTSGQHRAHQGVNLTPVPLVGQDEPDRDPGQDDTGGIRPPGNPGPDGEVRA